MAGAGMLAAGIIGSVFLGAAQDRATEAALLNRDARQGTHLAETYLTGTKVSVLGQYRALDQAKVAAAGAEDRDLVEAIRRDAKKAALTDVAKLSLGMVAAYLGLIVFFRLRGGYRPVILPHLPAGSANP